MEKPSRAPLQVASNVWPLALMTVASLGLAIAAARQDPGQAVHEAVITTLRAIDVNHASLQRDVLRARSAHLLSYDPLVNSVVVLHRLTADLGGVLSRPEFSDGNHFPSLIEELHTEIERNEELVERFKTKNALLQNSIGMFGQALNSLYRAPRDVHDAALVNAGDLGNIVMRFSNKPDEGLGAAIHASLSRLSASGLRSAAASDIETLKAHASVILKILPQVDAKIEAIQASRIPARVAQIQERYAEISAGVTARASLSRLVLGATSIGLCGYIVFLVYRLQRQSDRLRHRLRYEQTVAEIRARMADTCPEEFAEFMGHSLGRLARLLDSDSCGLAIVDGVSRQIKETYRLTQSEYNTGIVTDYAAGLISLFSEAARPPHAPPHHPMEPEQYCVLDDVGREVPVLMVGAPVSERNVAILHVRYCGRHPKMEPDALTLLHTTLQTLVDLTVTNHSREQRFALEHRLEHAQRLEAIGTLAGGIAHEFNNVLGAILGYGEMALQMLKKTSPTRHYIDEILKSGMKAKHIVDQILTFSRKRERNARPFDITEAIEDILPLLQVTLRQEIKYTLADDKGTAVIEGHPIEIHQITMNLCRNAIEASPEVDKVKIAVSVVDIRRRRLLSHGELAPGRYVRMCVADKGPGIPEQALPHIFEPFFTTKSASGGTGLGLSAVHGIVMQMGGGINVRSEEGAGTRFDLFFPASDMPPVPLSNFFEGHSVPTGKGERVAIVEPDSTLRELYEEKVAALGYEPLGFPTVQGLQDLLFHRDSDRPDLVLLGQSVVRREIASTNIETTLGSGRHLQLSSSAWGPDTKQKARGDILKIPFSSSALAHAISAKLKSST
jgi:signal transduction histidine kinase